ncbi:hypothetical protein ASE67_02665 [Sphingomonas sp. Leaf23]|uniref:hypothetical protein n=1 Tax=Sphingomonas sp. Leaf23 TaxID=1735689 RepID=UPI0006FD0813|nr:hypothetical protein [Sphingomonas sp. Leaf23]KQM88662.1 hypothetical protein ASE67_02665 [Sphingomonas sp. Leaf23]
MTALHPALDAALAGDRALIFAALRVDFDGDPALLLDGSGTATFSVDGSPVTFIGAHPVWGSWDGIDDYSDGAGDEAPSFAFSLLPPVGADPEAIATDDMQGTRVRFWIGAINPQTGAVIGEPLLLFDGEIDVPTPVIAMQSVRVDFDCVGGMERFFENEEGVRLAPAFHKRVWPGELGLDFITGVPDPVYWGQSTPSGVRI